MLHTYMSIVHGLINKELVENTLHVFDLKVVVTQALGLRPRQSSYKVAS
jgi:hypothetical protein